MMNANIKTSLAWTVCMTVSVGAFLAPALWNGFAIVFFDTGGYMERVTTMTMAPGRSFFYGLFLWATSIGWRSFWGPILLQSLCTLWSIFLMLRCHDLKPGPGATTWCCLGLALFTGISWYTSQLMPDGFVPLVVLALWLLGFRRQQLHRRERWGLTAIALVGLMGHMSCMALAMGLVAALLMARVIVRRRGWSLSVRWMPPVAVVVASLVLMPLLHLTLLGQAAYTPGGPVFIFGRLVQDGVAQHWLAEHCPLPGIKLCGLQDRLPKTADDFLWGGGSPFHDLGGWDGAGAELGHLVGECVTAYPGEVAWTSLRAMARQMVEVATGDGLDEFQGATRGVFSTLSPSIRDQFNAAHQQQGQIRQPLFSLLNQIHVPIALLSTLGLLLVIGWGLTVRRHDLAGLAMFTWLSLLGNAFICGALSNPHDRYQSRLVWLAPLVVGMAAASWWRVRTTPRNYST
jgi:hypothetical protein